MTCGGCTSQDDGERLAAARKRRRTGRWPMGDGVSASNVLAYPGASVRMAGHHLEITGPDALVEKGSRVVCGAEEGVGIHAGEGDARARREGNSPSVS